MKTARRVTAPAPRWRAAMASAVTPAERLAVAHDRLRAGLKWLGRNQRDAAARARDRDFADSLASDAVDYLTVLSDQIDERKEVTRSERQPASQAI